MSGENRLETKNEKLETPTSPFNLEATVRLLQRRPVNRVDRWVDGRFCRAVRTAEGMRLVRVWRAGSVEAPDVRIAVLGGPVCEETMSGIAGMVRWMLGLDAAPVPDAALVEREPRLGPVLDRLRGFRPPAFPDLFTTCVGVLPYQQLSLDAGTAILGRLVERFGPSLWADGEQWFDFPPTEVIIEAPEAELAGVGLSRAKATALRRLAERALAGDLDRERYADLPTAAAMVALQKLPGIGPWSAGLILLRGLRRMDVFPAGDSGAARSLTALLDLPEKITPREADEIATRFGELRGYLYFLALGNRMPWLGAEG
jgi:3-methyladenine DNA glycosylase/8-oxoguanine DNA glycosylase